MPRLHAYIIGAALALVAAAPAAEAQRTRVRERDDDREYTSRLDTTFAFGARGSAEISARGGDIIVRAWTQPQVHIRAVAERGSIRLDGSSSYFTLGVRGEMGRGSDTRFEVTVPIGTRVRASTQSGDITIAGTKADAEVNTMSGDIEIDDVAGRVQVGMLSGDVQLRRVNGDVRVNAVSGDVILTDATGDVEATSVSGEILLRGVTSKSVRAGSTSGDVLYEGTVDAAGRYDLSSHSGEVEIVMPQGASAQVSVSTYSGTIDSDFPIVLPPGTSIGSNKSFTFNIGRGDARVTAKSFSGDVTIRQRGGTRSR